MSDAMEYLKLETNYNDLNKKYQELRQSVIAYCEEKRKNFDTEDIHYRRFNRLLETE